MTYPQRSSMKKFTYATHVANVGFRSPIFIHSEYNHMLAGVIKKTLLTTAISLIALNVFARDQFDEEENEHGACSKTTMAVHKACLADRVDDYWTTLGNCINISDTHERRACKLDAKRVRFEAKKECKEQRQARLALCEALGEARYDPNFAPENFVDPQQIGQGILPNPYFPLVAGNRWIYRSGDETISVTVTTKTKLIEGVTCVVINDLVEENGVAIEDTNDWYAQDLEGNVWYCGEISENFELFAGDTPTEPELVDIEGSWKAGREGAKPGILIPAMPNVGDIYRQEVSLTEAEDVAEVVDIAGTETVPAASCSGDCLITLEYTPIEPGIFEHKYYAPGIGKILGVSMEGEREELIEYSTMP